MKKVFVIFVLLTLTLALAACGKDTPQQAEPISYMQQTLYTSSSSNFRVSLSSGRSESLFVADGKVTDVKDFATLSVVPLHVDLYNDTYTYTLTGSTGSVDGELQKDNFGASYEGAIPSMASIGTPQTVTLKWGDHSEQFELTDLLKDAIGANDAKQIAQKTLAAKLEADDHDREIYVRFINDASTPDSPYYWYVAFIHSPTDYYSVLIDPTDGTVLSVNP